LGIFRFILKIIVMIAIFVIGFIAGAANSCLKIYGG